MNIEQKPATQTMAELLKAPILVIDPDIAGRIYCCKDLSEQQLEALTDCDFIVVHPLFNLYYSEGCWNAIVMGQVKEMNGVLTIEKVS